MKPTMCAAVVANQRHSAATPDTMTKTGWKRSWCRKLRRLYWMWVTLKSTISNVWKRWRRKRPNQQGISGCYNNRCLWPKKVFGKYELIHRVPIGYPVRNLSTKDLLWKVFCNCVTIVLLRQGLHIQTIIHLGRRSIITSGYDDWWNREKSIEKREEQPTNVAVLDSQSVKTTAIRGPRGLMPQKRSIVASAIC